MIYRSKAPLRIGLAGGGTDVSPYSDLFGGAILNATVSLYARTTIIPNDSGKIIIRNADNNEQYEFDAIEYLSLNDKIDLQIGVYNRIVKDFSRKPLSF